MQCCAKVSRSTARLQCCSHLTFSCHQLNMAHAMPILYIASHMHVTQSSPPSNCFAGRLYVWVGHMAHPLLVHSAAGIARRMARYDSLSPLALEATNEGEEPAPLVDALCRDPSSHATPRPISARTHAGRARAAAPGAEQGPFTCAAYTPDFEQLTGAAGAAERTGAAPWLPDENSEGAALRGADVVFGKGRVAKGSTAKLPLTQRSGSRSHSTSIPSERQHHSAACVPGAPPVVPPLQLNTFPISPPLSSRTAVQS